LPSSESRNLGLVERLSGQSRVPDPPAGITAQKFRRELADEGLRGDDSDMRRGSRQQPVDDVPVASVRFADDTMMHRWHDSGKGQGAP
jgi:hypothetical protein